MSNINHLLQQKLEQRKSKHYLRSLSDTKGLIDFASNDYLGFAQSVELQTAYERLVQTESDKRPSGSTGSRLLTGNSNYCEALESSIAEFHQAPSSLIFNSGYNANLGLLGSLGLKGDSIVFDELIHASMIDGIKLSRATAISFKHNDLSDLESKLKSAPGRKILAIESLYSMDGDDVPLKEMIAMAKQYDAFIVLDEAHAVGVFGEKGAGLAVAQGLSESVDARVVTFGKSLGVHGAAVLGSERLRDYLINYARPFIFTTALPQTSLRWIKAAYHCLAQSNAPHILMDRILLFKQLINDTVRELIISGNAPNQALIIPDNVKAKALSLFLKERGLDARAILFPSVPKGMERLRICIHAHNSEAEIKLLADSLNAFDYEVV